MTAIAAISSQLSQAQRVARAETASREFEAMFASQMLQPMMETVPVDDTTGGGQGEEVFRSMMVQEFGKVIANGRSLGIAPLVKQEMLRQQEIAQ